MVGNLKKLSITFMQTTFPDSIVRLHKNRIQPKLFQIPNCVETLSWNSNISQTRSDIEVILDELERHLGLVIPIKIS